MTDHLTHREWEVLRLVARGHSDKAIARLLLISRLTVRKHLEHIYTKLGVHSRTEAVASVAQTSARGDLPAWLSESHAVISDATGLTFRGSVTFFIDPPGQRSWG